MSAKAVADKDWAAREAVLRAMQEAAERASGKKGAPRGPQHTKFVTSKVRQYAYVNPAG